ncbi:hypothetical protein RI367_000639 [Sorochytrium milnesiophthora]
MYSAAPPASSSLSSAAAAPAAAAELPSTGLAAVQEDAHNHFASLFGMHENAQQTNLHPHVPSDNVSERSDSFGLPDTILPPSLSMDMDPSALGLDISMMLADFDNVSQPVQHSQHQQQQHTPLALLPQPMSVHMSPPSQPSLPGHVGGGSAATNLAQQQQLLAQLQEQNMRNMLLQQHMLQETQQLQRSLEEATKAAANPGAATPMDAPPQIGLPMLATPLISPAVTPSMAFSRLSVNASEVFSPLTSPALGPRPTHHRGQYPFIAPSPSMHGQNPHPLPSRLGVGQLSVDTGLSNKTDATPQPSPGGTYMNATSPLKLPSFDTQSELIHAFGSSAALSSQDGNCNVQPHLPVTPAALMQGSMIWQSNSSFTPPASSSSSSNNIAVKPDINIAPAYPRASKQFNFTQSKASKRTGPYSQASPRLAPTPNLKSPAMKPGSAFAAAFTKSMSPPSINNSNNGKSAAQFSYNYQQPSFVDTSINKAAVTASLAMMPTPKSVIDTPDIYAGVMHSTGHGLPSMTLPTPMNASFPLEARSFCTPSAADRPLLPQHTGSGSADSHPSAGKDAIHAIPAQGVNIAIAPAATSLTFNMPFNPDIANFAAFTHGALPSHGMAKFGQQGLTDADMAAAGDDADDGEKRISHKVAEQKRRNQMKDNFDELRMVIPGLQNSITKRKGRKAGGGDDDAEDDDDEDDGKRRGGRRSDRVEGKGISKIAVLKIAHDYVNFLKAREQRFQELLQVAVASAASSSAPPITVPQDLATGADDIFLHYVKEMYWKSRQDGGNGDDDDTMQDVTIAPLKERRASEQTTTTIGRRRKSVNADLASDADAPRLRTRSRSRTKPNPAPHLAVSKKARLHAAAADSSAASSSTDPSTPPSLPFTPQ